jgi:hypothetical protein
MGVPWVDNDALLDYPYTSARELPRGDYLFPCFRAHH